ncbi:CHY zinc finger protein [Leucobacter sp.]
MRVLGGVIDDETRCVHYHGPTDVIAMRFKCCDEYFPCLHCHEEYTSPAHPIERWAAEDLERRAVLCGACGHELRIAEYLVASGCPVCAAPFNPGCRLHHDAYFAFPRPTGRD